MAEERRKKEGGHGEAWRDRKSDLGGGVLIRIAEEERVVGGTVLALSHIEVWEFTLL